MKLKKLINEEKEAKGTYAGVLLSQDDEDRIISIVKEMGIPNPIPRNDIHITLLYSRKVLPNYKPADSLDIWSYPTEFHIFNGQDGKDILVLKLNSPDLVKRHKELMKEHGATYDFPEYIPHITLSYDLEDYMNNEKDRKQAINEKFKSLLPKEIYLTREYEEELNLDWEDNND